MNTILINPSHLIIRRIQTKRIMTVTKPATKTVCPIMKLMSMKAQNSDKTLQKDLMMIDGK